MPDDLIVAAVAEKPAVVEPHLEMLQASLVALQSQIQFADTKAGFLATLDLLLFSIIAQQAEKLISVPAGDRHAFYYLTATLLGIYTMLAFGAICCVVMAVIPRIRGGVTPGSRSHFAHVYSDYGADYERYSNDVLTMTTQDWATDLAWQILEVSHIAHTKHRFVRKGSMWAAVSMAFWAVSLIAVLAVRVI